MVQERSSPDLQLTTPVKGDMSAVDKGIFTDNHTTSHSHRCAACHQVITDKYLLKAVDQVWHEGCLKCSCCNCRLADVGSSLFIKSNLFLCKRDYLRLFGAPGQCSACYEAIPAFELVMRAREHVYHLDCFACQQCRLRFCVGDRFYLSGNKIYCENHFPEQGIDLSNHSTVNDNTRTYDLDETSRNLKTFTAEVDEMMMTNSSENSVHSKSQ